VCRCGRHLVWVVGIAVVAAISAGALGVASPARGGSPGVCTPAQKAAQVSALKAFEAGMRARRRAFFRHHHRLSARRRFLRAQRARLRALQSAAGCGVQLPAAGLLATIPLAGANRFTAAAGSLWVSSYSGSGEVARIDPTTNQVVETISVGAGGDIGFGFGSIWEVDGQTSPSAESTRPLAR
jgi:hypothetical protein